MPPKISLAMIARDEAENLAECLNSLKAEVAEIIIVDTGSVDNTINIARGFTDKIYDYEWQGDFSAARNFALSKCSGDWILYLDADETLDCREGGLQQLIADNPEAEVFVLPLYTDTRVSSETFPVVRLFLNAKKYRFVGKIHEQVEITNPQVVGLADAPAIRHRLASGKGYRRKRGRNIKLLTQALATEPENYFLQYYLGFEWLCLGRQQRALACLQQAAANIEPDCIQFRSPVIKRFLDCLKALGQWDKARQVCLDECKRYPDYADIHYEAGTILAAQGDYQQGLEYFQKAIQAGRPSQVYYHAVGTESFLAIQQMGFCCEKLGLSQVAEQYYRQAMAADRESISPLYSLFLLKVNHLPPEEVFTYFEQHRLCDAWLEALASMFLAAGMPQWAAKCYDRSETLRQATSLTRINSLIYCGRTQEALAAISAVTELTAELATSQVVAYLLAGDYCTAKQRGLSMWVKFPEKRSTVWALLSLIAHRSKSAGYRKPEKTREIEVAQSYLTLLADCLRFMSGYPDNGLYNLTLTIRELLQELSAQGNLGLVGFFQQQQEEIRSLLNYKYTAARGLYEA